MSDPTLDPHEIRYELFYWPEIPGRGEFVRLVLEDVGAIYDDIARCDEDRIEAVLGGELASLLPFAPPILRAGDVVVAQTVAITSFLGERFGLVPTDEQGRLAALTYALTIADLVTETHDTHHPLAVSERYEQQKPAARRRAKLFRTERLPKFLRYFEHILDRNAHGVFVGDAVSYVDLAAFHVLEGLCYAFPNAVAALRDELPKLFLLRDRIADRPLLAEYLASDRRLPFNKSGIFRHYPELDAPRTSHKPRKRMRA